ncbi:hypothetical protein BC826DRAFT_1111847 [Russula brevipes]|nr:hypothetical protein BC826DRAFT_1111847 [Russula brevipes]
MASGTSGAAGKATGPQSPDAIGGSPQMQIHAEDVSSPQHSQTRGGDVSNPQVAQMREGDVPDPRITQMREGEPQSMPERQEEAMSARPTRVGIQSVATNPQGPTPKGTVAVSPQCMPMPLEVVIPDLHPSHLCKEGSSSQSRDKRTVISRPSSPASARQPVVVFSPRTARKYQELIPIPPHVRGIEEITHPGEPDIIWVDIPVDGTMRYLPTRKADDLPPNIKGRAKWGKPRPMTKDEGGPQQPRRKEARKLTPPTRHDEADLRPDSYYLTMGSIDLPIEFVNASEWHRVYWQSDQEAYALDGTGQLAAYRCGLGTPGQPAILGRITKQRSAPRRTQTSSVASSREMSLAPEPAGVASPIAPSQEESPMSVNPPLLPEEAFLPSNILVPTHFQSPTRLNVKGTR